MKNVVNFKDKDELNIYFRKNKRMEIGEGSEGTVYLNRNNEIIKNMADSYVPKKYEDYPNIILADDIKLDSFIFPKEIFILNGNIVGYRKNYFKDNIFTFEDIYKLDINSLIKARKKFIEDAKVMTDKGYFLYDLPNNILFDNKSLVAIDTLDYKKMDDITLDKNIETIDYTLLLMLDFMYSISNELDSYERKKLLDVNKPFEEEIEKVYKLRR